MEVGKPHVILPAVKEGLRAKILSRRQSKDEGIVQAASRVSSETRDGDVCDPGRQTTVVKETAVSPPVKRQLLTGVSDQAGAWDTDCNKLRIIVPPPVKRRRLSEGINEIEDSPEMIEVRGQEDAPMTTPSKVEVKVAEEKDATERNCESCVGSESMVSILYQHVTPPSSRMAVETTEGSPCKRRLHVFPPTGSQDSSSETAASSAVGEKVLVNPSKTEDSASRGLSVSMPPGLVKTPAQKPYVELVEPQEVTQAESSPAKRKPYQDIAMKLHNYSGPGVLVLSCVSKDKPYYPHPHRLVGRGCKKGVYFSRLRVFKPHEVTLPDVEIQRTDRRDVTQSLLQRKDFNVDPFQTGFKEMGKKMDLNVVRLCFQVFLPDEQGKITVIVPPKVSQPIHVENEEDCSESEVDDSPETTKVRSREDSSETTHDRRQEVSPWTTQSAESADCPVLSLSKSEARSPKVAHNQVRIGSPEKTPSQAGNQSTEETLSKCINHSSSRTDMLTKHESPGPRHQGDTADNLSMPEPGPAAVDGNQLWVVEKFPVSPDDVALNVTVGEDDCTLSKEVRRMYWNPSSKSAKGDSLETAENRSQDDSTGTTQSKVRADSPEVTVAKSAARSLRVILPQDRMGSAENTQSQAGSFSSSSSSSSEETLSPPVTHSSSRKAAQIKEPPPEADSPKMVLELPSLSNEDFKKLLLTVGREEEEELTKQADQNGTGRSGNSPPSHPCELRSDDLNDLFGYALREILGTRQRVDGNSPGIGKPDIYGRQNFCASPEPYIEIVEQPLAKGCRFKSSAKRHAGTTIYGETNRKGKRTYPTIRICNYNVPVDRVGGIAVVSLVTKNSPYSPHPHTLEGNDCKRGVCTVRFRNSNTICFPKLTIVCCKKEDVSANLKERQEIRVDPFQTGFDMNPGDLDLEVVCMAFQLFLPDRTGLYRRIVKPVVSNPVFNKKFELDICRMSRSTGSPKGGEEVFLFCNKIKKDDICVRFFEENEEGRRVWEARANFARDDIHRQFGIAFHTPSYMKRVLTKPVAVSVELYRPSNGWTSVPRPFTYKPDPCTDSDKGLPRRRPFATQLPPAVTYDRPGNFFPFCNSQESFSSIFAPRLVTEKTAAGSQTDQLVLVDMPDSVETGNQTDNPAHREAGMQTEDAVLAAIDARQRRVLKLQEGIRQVRRQRELVERRAGLNLRIRALTQELQEEYSRLEEADSQPDTDSSKMKLYRSLCHEEISTPSQSMTETTLVAANTPVAEACTEVQTTSATEKIPKAEASLISKPKTETTPQADTSVVDEISAVAKTTHVAETTPMATNSPVAETKPLAETKMTENAAVTSRVPETTEGTSTIAVAETSPVVKTSAVADTSPVVKTSLPETAPAAEATPVSSGTSSPLRPANATVITTMISQDNLVVPPPCITTQAEVRSSFI